MTELWIDAHISPAIALWINQTFSDINAKSVRGLGLRDAKDIEIFMLAKDSNVILVSKDADFQQLFFLSSVSRLGDAASVHAETRRDSAKNWN